MNRYEFINHVKGCFKRKKKLLKIAEISDGILLRIKRFERLRRGYKLQISQAEDHKNSLEFSGEMRNYRSTCFFTPIKLSELSEFSVAAMKAEYHMLVKVSKNLRKFQTELSSEPLFTKNDLIVRRDLIQVSNQMSETFMPQINVIIKELTFLIDSRLSKLEKFVQLSKEGQGGERHDARRGATMSGGVDLMQSSNKIVSMHGNNQQKKPPSQAIF